MPHALCPSEDLRQMLRRLVAEDGRGWDGVAAVVGVRGPTLHRFLNTPGAGSEALPRLCKLYGIDQFEHMDLDDWQREILRILEAAKDAGRDPEAIVGAFRTLTGIPSAPTDVSGKPRGRS